MRSTRKGLSLGRTGVARMNLRKRTGLVRTGWVLATAMVMAAGVAACGGGSTNATNHATNYGTTLYGALPTAGTPTAGGSVTVGQLTGGTPNDIFPIDDCTDTLGANADYLDAEMYLPLYSGPDGARAQVDYPDSLAASAPVASNGDTTYTIHLKTGLTWSGGAPVVANDVIFYIDLLKAAVKESPGNWCQYVPGQFPSDVVSATAPDAHTVVIKLNKAYNPGYFLYNQLEDTEFGPYGMPSTDWNVASANGPHLDYANPANAKKIFDYLNKAGQVLSQFTTNPLWKDVDGPYTLKDFDVTNGSYDLVPNPKYTGASKSHLSEVSLVTYTSRTAMENAYKTGALDVGDFDEVYISQIPELKRAGYTVFGGPGFDYLGAEYNFADTSGDWNNIIKQVYIRAALQELDDEQALIKGVFKGAAVPQYDTVPSSPQSPYTPADAVTPSYPYSPSAAVALLKSHGWKVVPGGQTTCEKAGSGAGECGAGIPAGTALAGVWVSDPQAISPATDLMTDTVISAAKKYAGFDFQLKTVPINVIQDDYSDSYGPKSYVNKWGVNSLGGFDFDYYPTMEGVMNPGASFNSGDYDDANANKLMAASVSSSNTTAVTTEASYFGKNPPVLWWPNYDGTFAVNQRIGGPANSFLNLGGGGFTPEYWYVKKK